MIFASLSVVLYNSPLGAGLDLFCRWFVTFGSIKTLPSAFVTLSPCPSLFM